MMDWFNHPSYVVVRDRIIDRFRSRFHAFLKLDPIVFLCGAANSANREWFRRHIRKVRPDAMVFLADEVWVEISRRSRSNALQMEEELAGLSDLVIVIVESPGTFTELGAFSVSTSLRHKLLPILDIKHSESESFINTGPVRWVNKDSRFKPVIRADFSVILEAAEHLDPRLRRLPRKAVRLVKDKDVWKSPRHVLFLMFDLLSVIGPARFAHIQDYLIKILGRSPKTQVRTLLGLGISLDRVCKTTIDGHTYYYSASTPEYRRPTYAARYFSLSDERARTVGVLQKFDTARALLQAIAGKSP